MHRITLPTTTPAPHRRPARRAAVFAFALLAACGSDDDASPATGDVPTTTAGSPATTAAPATTAPATTAAVTTTVAPSTSAAATTTSSAPTTAVPTSTTSGEPVTKGLDPPCAERDRAGSTGGGDGDEDAFGSFGPLGSEPVLAIDLPAARSPDARDGAPFTTAEVIAGGVLLAVREAAFVPVEESMLAAIDTDGAVRWIRCVSGNITGLHASPAGASALVRTLASDGETTEWLTATLESGDIAPAPLFTGGGEWNDSPLLATDDLLVFGPPDELDRAARRLLLVDLETHVEEELPLPAEAADVETFELELEVDRQGEIVLLDPHSSAPAVLAAMRDGRWTSEPEAIAESFPVRATFVFADTETVLEGRDASGETVWTSTDVTAFDGEGFQLAESDGVAVVAGCWEPVAPGELCDRHEVGGIDSATGDVLWRLPGDRGVGPVGDGYALVTDGEAPGTWQLIDTSNGELVDDSQRWTGISGFGTACCGEDEVVWTHRFGGVVVATDRRQLSVWYPQDADLGTHSVTLP